MSGLDVDVALERSSHGEPPFRLRAAFSTGGDITVVCGPSGSGKSSLLLALLGALHPIRGRVTLENEPLLDSSAGIDLPVRRRRIAMVFQDALLFPHLNVRQNVAFGLRPDAVGTAATLLKRVGADHLERRRSSELSGGQAQRVALARALACEPRALLLDEPFSALDAAAREELGRLLTDLQAERGIPFVHVTHDLSEAMRLGRQLVLVEGGRVVQVGAPADVVARPASLAAARAVGTENMFAGVVRRHEPAEGWSEVAFDGTVVQTALLPFAVDDRVMLGLRAEDILLSLRPIRETSARNVLAGTVQELAPRGPGVEVRVTTPASFRVLVTPASVRELGLEPGKPVHLLIKAASFHLLS